MVDVSVIVVNLNTKDLLRACLDSVFAHPDRLAVEVIVVDNHSEDGSVEMVVSRYPSVILQVNPANEGFAKPNNDGMRQAKGKYFFLLNSDAVVLPGCLGALSRFLDGNPQVGACGPMIRYPDGRIQRSVCKTHSLWTHVCDMLFLDKLFPQSRLFGGGEMTTNPYDELSPQEVESIMGAAVLVRRAAVDETGGFDERLSVYYNEMDWFRRMRQLGWGIAYVPDACVYHHRGATAAKANWRFELYDEMYKNVFHYYRKHYGLGGVVLYRLLLAVGFVPRAVGWNLASVLRPSAYRRHMAQYSFKTLLLGLTFWKNV